MPAAGLLSLDAAFIWLVVAAVEWRGGNAEGEESCGRGSAWFGKDSGFGGEFAEQKRSHDSLASGETAVVGEAHVGDVAEVLFEGGAGEVCPSRFHSSLHNKIAQLTICIS